MVLLKRHRTHLNSLRFITIMSKLVKTILLAVYVLLITKYLKNTLTENIEVVLDYKSHSPSNLGESRARFRRHRNNITALRLDFKKPIRFKTDLKYILKYTNSFLHYGTSLYKNGQQAFVQNKCKYINCYITNDRTMLMDTRNFDAVLFDVENGWDGSLLLREPYQKFIFMASESSSNYPLCDGFYNGYYNLTWTYKLDSDIRWTYLSISDKHGNIVGPRVNMTWIDPMKPTPDEVKNKLRYKKRAAAWFVSNCNAKSGRSDIAKAIEIEMKKYGHILDIYGWCGRKTCPKDRFEECLSLLESDYYFYLSFENSFSEDYVTEKILYPLQHFTVPIVYGGANYSRFLPPNSYIDARTLNATEVASEMHKAIRNPDLYQNYFKWHNHYEYLKAGKVPEVCKLCKILNEDNGVRKSYKHFLHWWNPDYVSICNHGQGRILVKNPRNVIELEPRQLNKELVDLFQ